METSFLPDRCGISLSVSACVSVCLFVSLFSVILGLTFELRVAEDAVSVSVRLRSKLSVKGCGNNGCLSRNKYEVLHIDLDFEFYNLDM